MAGFGNSAPLALAGLAIGVVSGVVIGYAIHAFTAEPQVVEKEKIVQQELSDEELLAMCEEISPDERSRLMGAQRRVEDLEALLAEKEAALAELKSATEADESRRRAAAKQWKQMEAEIEQLKAERDAAIAEREELREELKQTLKELDRQIVRAETFKKKAKKYKRESTENSWLAFVNGAKVEICDKGSRKRHEKCHEAVDAALGPSVREKYATCVNTYQATPVLKQAEKGEELPAFAEWLPDDNKFTRKGWYIIFCDPTLPEGQTLDDLDRELLEQ
ncbi:MAG: hypothetical protein D6798_17425 [Deltaproteobacteria bacterium]|nr:MAG: hypothetical protein D6798_17425 [Deltaproteobacteria bacterium]